MPHSPCPHCLALKSEMDGLKRQSQEQAETLQRELHQLHEQLTQTQLELAQARQSVFSRIFATFQSRFWRGESVEFRILFWFIAATPLLWFAGLLAPAGFLMSLWFFYRLTAAKAPLYVVPCLWAAVGLAQAISVIINCFTADLPFTYLLYRLASTTVSGWFILALALAAGRYFIFSPIKFSRLTSILSLYILSLGTLSFLLWGLGSFESLSILSPVGSLVPSSLPSSASLFTLNFFSTGTLFGLTLPRLTLFYPWAECLGFAGTGLFFVCLNEEDKNWKTIGVSGALFAIFLSMSRAAIVSFCIALAIYLWLRSERKWLFLGLFSVHLVLLVAYFNFVDFSIAASLREAYELIASMRGDGGLGSTIGRNYVYDASYKAFLESPLWGYGWPGEDIADSLPMPIGSHSTIYGLLYTGGIFTFLCFCIAILATLGYLFKAALGGSTISKASFAIAVALAVMSYGETLYSFSLPIFFVFLWLGMGLRPWVPTPLSTAPVARAA